MKKDIVLKINGEEREVTVESRQTLLDVLRNHLGLTGTKKAAATATAAPVPSSSMVKRSVPA